MSLDAMVISDKIRRSLAGLVADVFRSPQIFRSCLARAIVVSSWGAYAGTTDGNLIGHRDGKKSGLAPIIAGSHIDTVPNGGHYDGIVGVMGAI